jgi:membrane associated rhomboid family serine protease
MRPPPPISRLRHYPVTGGIVILAIVTSLGWWFGQFPVSRLEMSGSAWHGEPWRLIMGILPHVNLIHLAFDVYWTWVFGTIIEEAMGSLFIALLILIIGVGSSAAEFAVSTGGVGLSGVGYGLFGFLWVLSRRNQRFAGVVDRQTVQLFVVWFFLCIFTTAIGILPVGNVAHGFGAVMGIVIGWVVASQGWHRWTALTTLCGLFAAALLCASVFRPRVNFSQYGSHDDLQLGYEALNREKNEDAVRYLRRSVSYRHVEPMAWYDLGIAYQRLNQLADATDAYRHALAMEPNSQEYKAALENVQP